MVVCPAALPRPSRASPRRGRAVAFAAAALVLLTVAASAAPERAADAEVARLEAALAATPGDAALRRRLGDALFRAGRAFESLTVLNPERAPDARFVPDLRQAAELYRRSGRTDAAREALEHALALAPNDKSLYEALAAVYDAAGRAPRAQPAARDDAVPPAPDAPAAVAHASAAEPPSEPAAAPGLEPRRVARLAALAGAVVLAGLLLLRRARGRGDLAVSIELPADRRGRFSVRLARKRPRRRATVGDEAAALAERASSRLEHNMVSRDTQFHGLETGAWWVLVEGVVEAPGPAGVRTAVFEEREVRVERGRALRIEFDLRPRECPIELRIVQGGGPAPRARLALAGDLTSLRYAPQGTARLSLPAGLHRVVVGGADRVAEREIRIDELAPKTVVIDLADGGVDLVFAGCEPTPSSRTSRATSRSPRPALDRAGQSAARERAARRVPQERGESREGRALLRGRGPRARGRRARGRERGLRARGDRSSSRPATPAAPRSATARPGTSRAPRRPSRRPATTTRRSTATGRPARPTS